MKLQPRKHRTALALVRMLVAVDLRLLAMRILRHCLLDDFSVPPFIPWQTLVRTFLGIGIMPCLTTCEAWILVLLLLCEGLLVRALRLVKLVVVVFLLLVSSVIFLVVMRLVPAMLVHHLCHSL